MRVPVDPESESVWAVMGPGSKRASTRRSLATVSLLPGALARPPPKRPERPARRLARPPPIGHREIMPRKRSPRLSLTVPDCPTLPLNVPDCPRLSLTVPDCPWLPLAAPGCPWLPLTAPDCPWLPLAAPGCPWLPLAAPGCP